MKARTKTRARTTPKPRLMLTLTRPEWGTLQDALQDGMPAAETAAARYQALQRTLYALTGDRRTTPGDTTPGQVRATAHTSPIHTPLTLDDRDAIDAAKGRALRLTAIVAHLIEGAPDDGGDDEVDPAGLLDLVDLIREDLTMITLRLVVAEDRQTGGGSPQHQVETSAR